MSSPRMFMPHEGDDVQFVTERSNRHRERSVTVGREEELEEPEESPGLFADEIIDLTSYEADIARPGLLQDGEFPLERYGEPSGSFLHRGDFIQVRDIQLAAYDIDFVQVQTLAQDQAGRCKIRGIPFVRTRRLQGKFPKKLNEVCMVLHMQRRDNREESPVLVDVSPQSIVKKRTLITTNAVYPEHCYESGFRAHVENKERQRRMAEASGHLVCRWRFKIYFILRQNMTRPEEEILERITSEDVTDSRYRVPEETLCNRWRGGRIKGGSWCPTGPAKQGVIDLEENRTPSKTTRNAGQRYTVFDSFSGAGGVSRGAQGAGFRIQYAVDKSAEVCETYKVNFHDTELFQMSIDGFIQTSKNRQIRVDVLHLSPPCQFFSPAHTHQSAHDDENIFALFGCNELINKLRPRIITLEQTFGITQDRHHQYLRALVGDFTQFGYSVRWKVVRLCTWGLAQDRKRLIMIAAGPGERLPPFPAATHSQHGENGLKSFTTIRRAIGSIRPGDDLHDVSNAKHYQPRRAPLDPDRLAGTITTSGGEFYYPDGTREFTLREYASLQGFPRYHQFRGNKTSIKRQIGNAFAPNTVRVLYRHLEDWLLKEDGIIRSQTPANGVFIVDDESDASAPLASFDDVVSSPDMVDAMDIDSDTENDRPRRL